MPKRTTIGWNPPGETMARMPERTMTAAMMEAMVEALAWEAGGASPGRELPDGGVGGGGRGPGTGGAWKGVHINFPPSHLFGTQPVQLPLPR
jgi:hypothetical protein